MNPWAFTKDWGDDAGGIAGVSRGECRLFLTNTGFREMYATRGPVVIMAELEQQGRSGCAVPRLAWATGETDLPAAVHAVETA